MSLSAQFNVKTWIPQNKRGAWRIINSLAILLAFFVPWVIWLKGASGIHDITRNGFDLLQWYPGEMRFEAFVLPRSLPDRLRVVLVSLPDFLGLIALLLYGALNVFAALLPTKRRRKSAAWYILAFALLALGVLNLLYMLNFFYFEWEALLLTLWGYWLAWAALVSAIWLEISSLQAARTKEYGLPSETGTTL